MRRSTSRTISLETSSTTWIERTERQPLIKQSKLTGPFLANLKRRSLKIMRGAFSSVSYANLPSIWGRTSAQKLTIDSCTRYWSSTLTQRSYINLWATRRSAMRWKPTATSLRPIAYVLADCMNRDFHAPLLLRLFAKRLIQYRRTLRSSCTTITSWEKELSSRRSPKEASRDSLCPRTTSPIRIQTSTKTWRRPNAP